VVAAPEIMFFARQLVTETLLSMDIYLIVAVIYLGVALAITGFVFGVPVGTVDVERSGVYDWTVRDLDAARDHARMIGVALEWLLAQRDEGGPPCRSTA